MNAKHIGSDRLIPNGNGNIRLLSGLLFLGLLLLGFSLKGQGCSIIGSNFPVKAIYDRGEFANIASFDECFSDYYWSIARDQKPTVELQAEAKVFMHYYILSLIMEGRMLEAGSSFALFLERFPDFEIDWDLDPPELVDLMDSFVVYEVGQVGLFAGPNYSLPIVPEHAALRYDIGTNGKSPTGPIHFSELGVQFGFEWTHYFYFRHGISIRPYFNSLSYSINYFSDLNVDASQTLGEWELTLKERLSYLYLPVEYQYRIPLSKTDLHSASFFTINTGAYLRFLVASEADVTTGTWSKKNGLPEYVEETRNIAKPTGRRNSITTGVSLGVGMQFSMERFVGSIKVEGDLGLSQLRRTSSEYADEFLESTWNYQLNDHNIWIHQISLVLGIGLPYGSKISDYRKNIKTEFFKKPR